MVSIYDACSLGKINQVDAIVKKCSNQQEIDNLLKKRNSQGYNCFEIAYLRKDYEMLKYLRSNYSDMLFRGGSLLRNIPSTESNDMYDVEGFFESIVDMSDDVALPLIQDFLEQGFDINSKDCCLSTLLHSACAGCQVNVVKFLVENGADVNAVNSSFRQPLHWLCENTSYNTEKEKFIQIANILVDNGALLNFKDEDDKTPFETLDNNDCKNVLWDITLKCHEKQLEKQANLYEKQMKEYKTITPNMQQLFVYLALENKQRQNVLNHNN